MLQIFLIQAIESSLAENVSARDENDKTLSYAVLSLACDIIDAELESFEALIS